MMKECGHKSGQKNNKYISLEVLLLLTFILLVGMMTFFEFRQKYKNLDRTNVVVQNEILETKQEEVIEEEKKPKYEWQIEIPKIGLIAEIKEGSDENTLFKYVGHIEGTSLISSNICLAAHTKTTDIAEGNFYFDRINELEIGDEIFYNYSNSSQKFIVETIKEVDETNLSVLEHSEETKLTLITCIKGKYYKRLCVICKIDA